MRYPIDLEALAASCHTESDRASLTAVAELCNDVYWDGRAGKKCGFLDEQKAIAAWEKETGEPATEHSVKAMRYILKLCRDAYQQGQESCNEDF